MSGWPPSETDAEKERQAEIARIRAFRGLPARPAKTLEEAAAGRITPGHVALLFDGGAKSFGEARDEQLIFDALPRPLRDFIRECPVHISAGQVASMLGECRSIEAVLKIVSDRVAARGRELVLRRYGARHPQAMAERFDLRSERTAKSVRENRRAVWLARRIGLTTLPR